MSDNRSHAEVRATKDGSTTLWSEQFSQHYHNPNGAVAESIHIFFEATGLPQALSRPEPLSVYETGFGTGLNLVLLHDVMNRTDDSPNVDFWSVEAFPVSAETAASFDFGEDLAGTGYRSWLPEIFRNLQPGMNHIDISPHLTLHLFYGTFEQMPDPKSKPGYVFHDPFSPEVNSELWTPEVFRRIASFCRPDAILATYCAATSARAAMAVGGWSVARARGALGKREMTVASPDPQRLAGLKRVNEERLRDRFRNGDFS